jgi:hypothetical protein
MIQGTGMASPSAQISRQCRVAPGVEFYVAAASSAVQRGVERAGDWDTLVTAGAHAPCGMWAVYRSGHGLARGGRDGHQRDEQELSRQDGRSTFRAT